MPVASLEYYIHQNDDEGVRAPIGSQWITITASYDPVLVASLKVKFDWEARRWNPNTKKWYVWRDLESRLLSILGNLEYGINWTKPARRKSTTAKPSEAKSPSATSSGAKSPGTKTPPASPTSKFSSSDDFALLELLPTARFEVAKASYRALCMVYHPDQGGDVRKMTMLNAAWERLCKRYGRRS
jgi:hypothetical protein